MRLGQFLGNEWLVRALRRGELPQTCLFAGPEGVGKRTLALALAQRANCRRNGRQDSCGVCPSCLQAEGGNHPDIRLYSPQGGTVKIESMRELSREAQFRPFQGRLRFFIVDEAEKMTEAAANSILKTLEEPPPTTRLILVTAFPHFLLPTIRSRCQMFRFRKLERRQIQEHLLERGMESSQAELRAAFSGGSLGAALALDLEAALKRRGWMLELLRAWSAGPDFAPLMRILERAPLRSDLKNREEVEHYLLVLHLLVEDLYFCKTMQRERLVNVDLGRELEKLAQHLSLEEIRSLLAKIHQGRERLMRNVNPSMCLETLWLKSGESV